MKSTGIIRRIDDLGRVVIPKEVRQKMRIVEGDIVKNEYEKGHYQYFKIFYCNRTYMWQGANKYGMLSKVYQMLGTLEVIGNIHDNPNY